MSQLVVTVVPLTDHNLHTETLSLIILQLNPGWKHIGISNKIELPGQLQPRVNSILQERNLPT
jgi:hypothetical protein